MAWKLHLDGGLSRIGMSQPIPVIDLFAGPGGLGEGFSSLKNNGQRVFKIGLSIEKDKAAHATLRLRSFLRQFDVMPETYREFLAGVWTLDQLYSFHPDEFEASKEEAWLAELGTKEVSDDEVDRKIRSKIRGHSKWVLIGGPPCQAYSLAGRARRSELIRERPGEYEKDHRHFLYKHYLRTIAEHKPTVFVMENVKGLLSTKIKGGLIVEQIMNDLRSPPNAIGKADTLEYKLYSLVVRSNGLYQEPLPHEFVIRAEDYGIPQRRHRLIIVGVISTLKSAPALLEKRPQVPLMDVLKDLPRIQGRISSRSKWAKQNVNDVLHLCLEKGAAWGIDAKTLALMKESLPDVVRQIDQGEVVKYGRGNPSQFCDQHLRTSGVGFVRNHESRSHMPTDLQRYFFAACFAKTHGRSPVLANFPRTLLPKHENVEAAVLGKIFCDRFRVQVSDTPATTITSHISKDGHYFIHPDPSQFRSLTVREAARVQTFPDDYVFLGNRTAQYQQVGNAVPPLLARKIASIVSKVLADK